MRDKIRNGILYSSNALVILEYAVYRLMEESRDEEKLTPSRS
jgi:hypothetical protein